jgi:hypothetical protein
VNSTGAIHHRYLIQLPVAADDLATAARVARVIARSLSFHNLVQCDDATVCEVDHRRYDIPPSACGTSPTAAAACSVPTTTGPAPGGFPGDWAR